MSVDEGHCPLEGAKQSDHSPDKVHDSERLGRLVYHEENGALKKGAFQMSEFIEARRRGASVARIEHSDAEELRRVGQELAGGRELLGVAVGNAVDARQIYNAESQRVFCVIDDGTPTFRSGPARRVG